MRSRQQQTPVMYRLVDKLIRPMMYDEKLLAPAIIDRVVHALGIYISGENEAAGSVFIRGAISRRISDIFQRTDKRAANREAKRIVCGQLPLPLLSTLVPSGSIDPARLVKLNAVPLDGVDVIFWNHWTEEPQWRFSLELDEFEDRGNKLKKNAEGAQHKAAEYADYIVLRQQEGGDPIRPILEHIPLDKLIRSVVFPERAES